MKEVETFEYGAEAIGDAIIDHICAKLADRDERCFDANILKYLGDMTKKELDDVCEARG